MELFVVSLVVLAAVGYVGWKVWGIFKPGPKASGCSCSGGGAKGGCSQCPMVKP